MERKYFLQIIWTCIVFINILTVNCNSALQICPEGYTYYSDGLCYPIERKPSPSVKVKNTPRCPDGYNIHTDGLCYPKELQPCPFDKSDVTTVETLAASPTISHTPAIEMWELQCPKGSIMIQNKCRKITCSLGEYYKGQCLHPECPTGLVWRGRKCQSPGYVTTILEIDNIFVNELKDKPIVLKTSHNKEIVHHTSSTTTTTSKPHTTRSLQNLKTTKEQATTRTNTNKYYPTNSEYNETCCEVITPRICKLYRVKWLCFNRRHQRCDSRICSAPVVHLKAPEIMYQHPVLVMPPNPQLSACQTNDCHNNRNIIDCSGCASVSSKNCSPHCYRYMCPNGRCNFVELKIYCTFYKGQTGCLPEDGCLWNWC